MHYIVWQTVHWAILLVLLNCFGIQVCSLQFLFLCTPCSPFRLCTVAKAIPTSLSRARGGLFDASRKLGIVTVESLIGLDVTLREHISIEFC